MEVDSNLNIPKYISQYMRDRTKNIKIAIFLNLFFTIIEIVGGLLTNSLALLSDALHDFGDTMTLLLAWFLENKSSKPADKKRTFGYKRLSLLSSFITALILIAGSLFILSQVVPRIFSPEPVKANGMILIAIFGLAFNWIGFKRLNLGHTQNEKMLSWHFLEDMLGWIAILVGGIIIKFWDLPLIDPILSIGFTVFVLWGVYRNLKESINIFLEGVPRNLKLGVIKRSMKIKEVQKIHDVHVWSLDGEHILLTAHIIVAKKDLKNSDQIRVKIKQKLLKYNIHHSTLEIESKEFCSGKECMFKL
jgi:cobalt-zinc-cadmium efflux system protein